MVLYFTAHFDNYYDFDYIFSDDFVYIIQIDIIDNFVLDDYDFDVVDNVEVVEFVINYGENDVENVVRRFEGIDGILSRLLKYHLHIAL